MRRAFSIILGGLVLAAAPAQAGTPQTRLAEALEGRVAGEPVNCITVRNIRSSRIIEDTAIIYEDRGGTLYVNYPRSGEESLNRWDAMVNRIHTGQLCSIDVVEMHDLSAGFLTGLVFLGEFVPYEKVRTASLD